MCVCVCVYIYIYIHTHTHIYIYVYIDVKFRSQGVQKLVYELNNIRKYSLTQKSCVRLYIYRVIKKDGLNFVRLYFLNYIWYVNDLHNI